MTHDAHPHDGGRRTKTDSDSAGIRVLSNDCYNEFTTNMIRHFKSSNCILLLLHLNCTFSFSWKCFNPVTSVEYVHSCPENRQSWNHAAERKNCFVHPPTCLHREKPLYHCVTNPWINATLEVCAPETSIVGYYCPEFNLEGEIIQENYQVSCKEASVACPFYYYSTEVYKYPSCFQINKERKNTTTADGLATYDLIKLQTTGKFQSQDDLMTTHSVVDVESETTDAFSTKSILVTVNQVENTYNCVILSVTFLVIVLASVIIFFYWELQSTKNSSRTMV